MFGKNRIRKQDLTTDGSTLEVHSIFYTIQGEGVLMGIPAVFIRLGGCNLRCYWCDTDFETGNKVMSVDEMVVKVIEADCPTKLVVITGGEPFRQKFLVLVTKLNSAGFSVQAETAGTLDLRGTTNRFFRGVGNTAIGNPWNNTLIVSPKTPKIQDDIRKSATAFKYIIKAGEISSDDGLPFACTQKPLRLNKKNNVIPITAKLARPNRGTIIFVQPCDEYDEEKNKANREACVDIAKRYGYRISLQMHKYLGVE